MTAFPASSRSAAANANANAHPPPAGDPLDWIEGRRVWDMLLCLNERERKERRSAALAEWQSFAVQASPSKTKLHR